jgi:hypothetical protein
MFGEIRGWDLVQGNHIVCILLQWWIYMYRVLLFLHVVAGVDL